MKKNKISIIATLAIVLTLALVSFSATAEEREDRGDGLEITSELNAGVSNQGEDMQLKVENQEQIQVGNKVESSVKVNIKSEDSDDEEDDDESLDDDSDDDGLEDADSDDQDELDDDEDDDGDDNMKNEKKNKENKEEDRKKEREEHRSVVAIAVQAMLQVAEKHKGIGEQVRVIAQNQVQAQEEVEVKLMKIEDRGSFAKFLIGPKYSEIKEAEKLLEQNKEQIQQLNQIKLEISNQADLEVLDQQVKILERVNMEIENSLKISQEGFSLFGWLSKVFSK